MRGLKIATGSLVATTAFVGLVAAAAAGRPLDHEPLRSAAPVGRLVATLPTEALALDGQRRTLARTETVTLGERGPNPVTPGERGATPGERGPNPVTPGERGATPGERGPSDAGGRVVPVEMTASALRAASPVPDVSGFPDLAWGEEGDAVTVAQRRLAELGFLDPGDVNGYFGEPTWSAVLAFQKFEELERTAWLDQVTWQRLFRPTGHLPRPRPTSVAGIEVDLERQLTFVINLDSPGSIRILNSSSGGN
ncbi:MAG: peptidoglycan-binding protein, partial [Acidimicrobiia bacterium]|nr:peptidoglycan-binding protein [Acidimicrobiia bacterium]